MVQQWWSNIVRWFASDAGQTFISGAVLPFVAIVAGGIIAGLIVRASIRRLLAQQDREHQSAAVATLIAAARRAANWSSLSTPEKDHVDHQLSESEVRVRLLPVAGAALAADWASHQLATMKRDSVSYSFQAEQDLAEFQDGLIAWHSKPSHARKLFAQDLAAWKYEGAAPSEDELVVKQREWAAAQGAQATAVIPQ